MQSAENKVIRAKVPEDLATEVRKPKAACRNDKRSATNRMFLGSHDSAWYRAR